MKRGGRGLAKRLVWIDLAKGIGVILMVIGHMPSMPSVIHDWIFSFHMPLFFFLSGYLFSKKKVADCFKTSIKNYLKPYVIYSIVFIAVDYISFRNTNDLRTAIERFLLGQGGFDVLWFFTSMFWVHNIYNFIAETVNDEKFKKVAIFVICNIAYGFTILKLGSSFKFMTSVVSMLFFATGVEFKKLDSTRMAVWGGIVNLLCLVIMHLTGWSVLDINSQQYGNLMITYIAAMSGVLFIVYISRILENYRIVKPIIFVGENSLYFFPLTTYIPVRIVSLLELNGVIVNGVGKLLSKLIGFVCTAVIVKIKNSIIQFYKYK